MAYKYLLTEEGATFRLYALIPLTVQPTYQQED